MAYDDYEDEDDVPSDPYADALERIVAEARDRTGRLSLGRLGLKVLPPELFDLKHLEVLNLGRYLDTPLWTQLGDDWKGLPLGRQNNLKGQLKSLESLPLLRELSVAYTDFSDLTEISGLKNLDTLNLAETEVTNLKGIEQLTNLKHLDLYRTRINDITALAHNIELETMGCIDTPISDLTPIKNLSKLRWINCGTSAVSSLRPLVDLPNMAHIACSGCKLDGLPLELAQMPALRYLDISDCKITGVPREIYYLRERGDNCLDEVLSHLRDLQAGSVDITDVKVIALGNGRVGKTQICRRLRGEDYDETESSTHGIQVTSANLKMGTTPHVRLNIWDFGGQDLYHGTHALFLRTSAIRLVVWAHETENAEEQEYRGVIFRNQPLAYWMAYLRHMAGVSNPTLIVQTRCDHQRDEAFTPPVTDSDVAGFEYCTNLHYSALNNRKREALDRALREAVTWLLERDGITQIGIGRARVLRRLQEMRDADATAAPEAKQYRTISLEDFKRLCNEAGNISSFYHLLRYFHNAGTVFYESGLFEDRIVVDQAWALDAIYSVFNREKCFRELKRLKGRFTRPLLELLVWREHSRREQELFLRMMVSSGVCFACRKAPDNDLDAIEYVAPDLLPERSAVDDELGAMWDASQLTETATFEFEMLHASSLRGVICRIGAHAGVAALYWQGGVCAYDTDTRSRALIQQHMQGKRGVIHVQTQGGRSRALLDQLRTWIEANSKWEGLQPKRLGAAASTFYDSNPGEESKLPASFGVEPVEAAEYFVSYAWGDDASSEGREREAVVDRLCIEAEKRGIRIIRDKTTLRFGDRISKFMRRIGTGDRVFVILSEKYLHSPNCMFELCEIWRYSRGDEEDFRRRVRVYVLPGAQASLPIERTRLALYWKLQYDEIAALIRNHGGEIIGDQDFAHFKMMCDFYHRVPDILATIYDTVQPRNFEELMEYGLGGPPSGHHREK